MEQTSPSKLKEENNNFMNPPAENLKIDTPNNSNKKKVFTSDEKKSEQNIIPQQENNEKINLLSFEVLKFFL